MSLENLPKDALHLKNPIVLVHGLGAKQGLGPIQYFHGLTRRLEEAGNTVFVANLAFWHGIEHRAAELKRQVEERFPDGKVNLIGHSMGGLDCRCLASSLGFGDRISSVTTIGTPNRGSALADLVLGLVPGTAFNAADRVIRLLNMSNEGFRSISRKNIREVFSVNNPDVQGVRYFSATSAIPDPVTRHSLPVFWLPHSLVRQLEGENDGFVSVNSARWGDHICTYPGDHYGQLGHFLGRSRGLDYISFHNEIFVRLREEGM